MRKSQRQVLTLLITQGAALAKSKTLFLEDGVRQTPQPVQRLVSLTDNEVSYLDWVAGLRPVSAPRDGSSH